MSGSQTQTGIPPKGKQGPSQGARAGTRSRALVRDFLLWALLAVPVVLGDRLGLGVRRPAWQTLGGLLLLAAAVALSRRRPVAALLTVAGAGLAASPALFTVSYGPALSIAGYLLGRRAQAARPALLAFGTIAAGGTALTLVRPSTEPVVGWLVLLATLLFGAIFPWLTGRHRRQSRALDAAGWSRAAQLEREQEIVADRARLRERTRIAQDMHDSLGHDLSLIALRAGALQVAPGMDEAHRAAAGELRVAAAEATERLREIIGLLREDAQPAAEDALLVPAGESIEALVERAADSGLPVRLVRTAAKGAPGGAQRPGSAEGGLTPIAGRAAYRVVQESLTNAAKHAPGSAVTVTVTEETEAEGRWGGSDRVTMVSVVTTGGPAPAASAGPATGDAGSAGSGLLGLRERVGLAGGTFTAGPRGDGFAVVARLPHGPVRPEPTAPGSPAAGQEYARARRTTRRGLALAYAGVGAAALCVVAGAFGWYAYTRTHAVLSPEDYAALRIGDPYPEVKALLPDLVATDPPSERAPAPPAGADCRYYRASDELFVSVDHFRLCFRDGRLVSKTVVPRAGTRTG